MSPKKHQGAKQTGPADTQKKSAKPPSQRRTRQHKTEADNPPKSVNLKKGHPSPGEEQQGCVGTCFACIPDCPRNPSKRTRKD